MDVVAPYYVYGLFFNHQKESICYATCVAASAPRLLFYIVEMSIEYQFNKKNPNSV
jgi:hypothetical protein